MTEEVVTKPVKAPAKKTVKIEVVGELYDSPEGIPTFYRTGDEVEITPFLQAQIDGGLVKLV